MKNLGIFLIFIVLWSCGGNPDNREAEVFSFSVMSFNVLYSTSVESTIETITETGADIVGLQEASISRIKSVGDSLGFYFHSFDKTTGNLSNNDTGILSRYPISDTLDDGVLIELPGKIIIAVFSVHLTPYPYEPYDIRDGKITTPDEVVNSAAQTRMPQINPILAIIDSLINAGVPVFLTGDFNEPSHLDWTQLASEKDMHFSMAVEWPVSSAVIEKGFEDSYRKSYPGEVSKNGITWTTNLSENEVHDRIDFVYHAIPSIWRLNSVQRAGRPDNEATLRIEGYESDHYAVIASYSVKN